MASKLIGAACVWVLLLTSSCSSGLGRRVNQAAYPFLAHAHNNEPVVWRKLTGPDFEVFYGQPKKSKDSGFGFYLGVNPSFEPDQAASQFKGRLGAFNLEWYQTSAPDGVRREAVLNYQTSILKFKSGEQEMRLDVKIHVWVNGNDESQVEALTQYLGGLELFREKPKDIVELQ